MPYLVLCLLVTLVYFPTFTGEFILDDKPLIKNNPYIKKTHPIASYFTQEDGILDKRGSGGYHSGYYRPLINISYWLDFKMWDMHAPGFRTTNLLLHLLSSFSLFLVITILVRDKMAAFLATLLFALHPVNTESVSWVAARNNILATLFALSSLYFFVKMMKLNGFSPLVLSAVLFMFAIFSKEFGLMILPVFFLYQILFSHKRGDFFKEMSVYLPFIFIFLFYFLLRRLVTGSLLTPSDIENLGTRIYFAPYLIALNLKVIFFPFGLHSFMIQYPDSYFGWEAFAGFSCLALLILFMWRERKEKVVLFALLSFFISLFPVLNIVPTSAVTLSSMRWLYFPLTFLLLALSRYIQKFIKMNRFLTLTTCGVVLIYLGAYSFILNKELWHDEESFFKQEVLRFNNNFYAGGLAENLLNKKYYPEADRYFRVAIENYPRDANNYINYSALLNETGRPADALVYLNRAKPLRMTHEELGKWFNNEGMSYFNLKKMEESLKSFRKGVIFSPNKPQFWANLGGAYGSMGEYKKSVDALKRGLKIATESIQLRENLAVTYIRMKEYEEAIIALEAIPDEIRGKNRRVERLLREARNGIHNKD